MMLHLAEIAKLVTGFILLAAAWGKTRTYHQFKQNLTESFYVPTAASRWLTPLIILAEWGLAALLLTNRVNPYPLMLASLALFSIFTCVVIYLLAKDEVVKCSCFGEQKRPISQLDLIRNLGLISAIGFYLAVAQPQVSYGGSELLLLGSIAAIISILAVNFHELTHLLIGST